MLKSIKYLPGKNTYVHLLQKNKKTKNYETSSVQNKVHLYNND